MRNLHRFTVSAGLGLLAMLAGRGVNAHGHHHDGGKFKHERICKEVACTGDQETKIREIFEAKQAKSKVEREAIGDLKDKLRAEFAKSGLDQKAIFALNAQIDTHEDALRKLHLETKIQLHSLLTPEQRAKLAKHKDGRHFKNGHRHRS